MKLIEKSNETREYFPKIVENPIKKLSDIRTNKPNVYLSTLLIVIVIMPNLKQTN